MSDGKKSQAIRGAYQLAAAAVRKEVKKLSDLSKTGVQADAQQHATLSSIAEQLYLVSVGSETPPAKLALAKDVELTLARLRQWLETMNHAELRAMGDADPGLPEKVRRVESDAAALRELLDEVCR